MKRRVLHVIPFLWSGAGRVVTRLCEQQAADGVDVHIATTGRAGAERDWPAYRRRLRRAGVTWHRLNTFDRRPESLWPAIDRAASLIHSLRPRVVHTHAGVPTLVATLAAPQPETSRSSSSRAPRTPRVVSQMYSWGPNRPAWMDTMDVLAFSRANQVVVSARKYERVLIDGGVQPSRVAYIPWGVDLPAFRPTALPKPAYRRTSESGRPIRLGFVGRLEPRKDQLGLVEAVWQLAQRGIESHLTLIGPDGDGDYADHVRRTVVARGLKDRVTLAGAVPSIWPYLASMDVFVSLSSDEGQGLAVLEAMAAGVPVVARPAAGLEDFLVDGDNGLWLPSRSRRHDAMGRALAPAISDRARLARLARRARQMVHRRYTWSATLRALETVYGW